MVAFCLMKIAINAGETTLILLVYELVYDNSEQEKTLGVTLELRSLSSALAMSVGNRVYQKELGSSLESVSRSLPSDAQTTINGLTTNLEGWNDMTPEWK